MPRTGVIILSVWVPGAISAAMRARSSNGIMLAGFSALSATDRRCEILLAFMDKCLRSRSMVLLLLRTRIFHVRIVQALRRAGGMSVALAVQNSRATPLPSVESHHSATNTTAAAAAAAASSRS